MILLPTDAYPRALPLLRRAEIRSHLALAHSVFEGRQAGRIFADEAAAPRTILVAPASGFCFLFGEADGGSVERFLPEFLARHLPGQPELYGASAAWTARLDLLFERRVVRTGFELASETAMAAEGAAPLPAGFTLVPLTARLREAWQEGLDPWIWRIWGGPEGFEARSFGFAVMAESTIASFCAACGIGGGEAEIEVGTVPEYRGQGLATAAARAFMQECRRRGLRPAWSCGIRNAPSDAVARKLGFVAIEEVTGYPLSSQMAFVGGRWVVPVGD
jgi:RimJ/RimL family protein N-acetyltransferase